LRGPFYYQSFAAPHDERQEYFFSQYIDDCKTFITSGLTSLKELKDLPPDVFRYKIVLGVMDNIRQIGLTLLGAAFWHDCQEESITQEFTRSKLIYLKLTQTHTDMHFAFLLEVYEEWSQSLSAYIDFLERARTLLDDQMILDLARNADTVMRDQGDNEGYKKFFRWRETDSIIQNITAIQLGLHEFKQRKEFREGKIVCVGLAFGAVELPCLAVTIGKRKSLAILPALAHVSHYSNKKDIDLIHSDEEKYLTEVLLKQKPLAYLAPSADLDKNTKYMIVDDNLTTGLTLQLARDFLVLESKDVIGAIIVRFPVTNRFIHMTLPKHTGTHPEVLFSFVRGLVGPSPYTRLLYPATSSNPYLDQVGHFDKAKLRIKRYLFKNGSIPEEALTSPKPRQSEEP
jgi:hypothetical protein